MEPDGNRMEDNGASGSQMQSSSLDSIDSTLLADTASTSSLDTKQTNIQGGDNNNEQVFETSYNVQAATQQIAPQSENVAVNSENNMVDNLAVNGSGNLLSETEKVIVDNTCEEMIDLIDEMFECNNALNTAPQSENNSLAEIPPSNTEKSKEAKLKSNLTFVEVGNRNLTSVDSEYTESPTKSGLSPMTSTDYPEPDFENDEQESSVSKRDFTPASPIANVTLRESAGSIDQQKCSTETWSECIGTPVKKTSPVNKEEIPGRKPTLEGKSIQSEYSITSMGSCKLRHPKKTSRDEDTRSRDSKIKSRMTLFNAFKVQKGKNAVKQVAESILSPKEDENRAIISNFVNDEIGYTKCVKFVSNFEKTIRDSMSSSSKAVLSKNDLNKLQLSYCDLNTHMERLEKLLESKKNGKDEGFGLVDFFGELIPLRIDYKNIAATIDRLLVLISKNKASSKMKKILPPPIRIAEWDITLDIESAINTIFERPQKYLILLHSMLARTKTTDPAYKHIRIVTNQMILLWDVMRLSRVGKKNSNAARQLTITTPVVELGMDGQRKYRILYIFMDCLVISSQSTKSISDITIKYCYPLKRCVSSRSIPQGYHLEHNENVEKNLNGLKGRIASTMDLISKYEHSGKKSDQSKMDKCSRQINEDMYRLLLTSPQYPLSVCLSQKNTHVFLFDTEADAACWDFIINGRSNCALMDESNPSVSELLSIVQDFNCKLLKNNDINTNTISSGRESQHRRQPSQPPQQQQPENFVEKPFVPPQTEIKINDDDNDNDNNDNTTSSMEYMHECLYLNIIFKRDENLVGDISFKMECDFYDCYFEKFKSQNIKTNEIVINDVVILTEKSRCIKFEIAKPKGKLDNIIYGPIDLCEKSILLKPFISFREDFENVGSLIVYAECFDSSHMFDFEKISHIKNINHFQPSIEQICTSENTGVPMVLRMCLDKIESLGLETVGLYRISGTMNKLNQLRDEFNKNIFIHSSDLDDYDIHDLCSFVKAFFRDLTDRLVPSSCTQAFVKWHKTSEEEDSLASLHACVEKLPRRNQSAFYELMNHLVKIVRLSSVNKMTSSNLSTVFGPNLFDEESVDNATQESLFTYVTIVKSFVDVIESVDTQ